MSAKSKKIVVKSKVWIEDENGAMIFGDGRVQLLNAVDKSGSLLSAAKELRMSYRAAWGKIKATEERLGRRLLISRAGGNSGGGSQLTPFGKALVERYRHLKNLCSKTSDTFFEDLFIDGFKDDQPLEPL
jgi:molybdate transport system regulatory protein